MALLDGYVNPQISYQNFPKTCLAGIGAVEIEWQRKEWQSDIRCSWTLLFLVESMNLCDSEKTLTTSLEY